MNPPASSKQIFRSPVSDAPLRAVTYEGVTIYTDNVSGGELIGPEQLQQVVATRHERFGPEFEAFAQSRDPVFGVPMDENERQLECPVCEGAMNVINYAGDTAIFVDKCGSCGAVWLDHEELEKIQTTCERWADAAPERIRAIAGRLETARREAVKSSEGAFQGSRFAFVNALINRVLDAA